MFILVALPNFSLVYSFHKHIWRHFCTVRAFILPWKITLNETSNAVQHYRWSVAIQSFSLNKSIIWQAWVVALKENRYDQVDTLQDLGSLTTLCKITCVLIQNFGLCFHCLKWSTSFFCMPKEVKRSLVMLLQWIFYHLVEINCSTVWLTKIKTFFSQSRLCNIWTRPVCRSGVQSFNFCKVSLSHINALHQKVWCALK